MKFKIGTVDFYNVYIPLLWGKRAVLSHSDGKLSIIDLSGSEARLEVMADEAWVGIEYSEKEDGIVIFDKGEKIYFYSPSRKLLRDLKGNLPECELGRNSTRIGSNTISGSTVSGFGVGLGVSEEGFFMGGPVPEGLAKLEI
ncbi:hypothetical protein [Vibrio alginolyticus]|uniref:hypothetical protein n=1 Tax=Vibrio alginolyticus TaxID=663 RepID=UPI001BD69F53|nr:hypothetical protein [Vibrio alginolyticus]MBT0003142.1 hypothetical protein [Vibrio alginolyticus]